MISIVIPAYNEERNLDVLYANIREVLDSQLGDSDWELVVVDNCSKDGTPEMVDEVVKIRVDVRWLLSNREHHVAMTTFATGKGE